jgi:hypothetical protein
MTGGDNRTLPNTAVPAMAPIICKTTRTVYYPAPKSASSTLRAVFFEIENGYRFTPFIINGAPVDLFWLYGHSDLFERVEVPPGHEVFTVVRDPIERFLSFYKWGVIDNHCGFDRPVEVNEFVAGFATYLNRTPKIRFHLSPQFLFIGKDLAYYNRIFRMEDLGELGRYLSDRAQAEITVGRVNTSSPRAAGPELTPDSRARLAAIYREDYELLKDFYSPAAARSA